jgi:hypothetical protein
MSFHSYTFFNSELLNGEAASIGFIDSDRVSNTRAFILNRSISRYMEFWRLYNYMPQQILAILFRPFGFIVSKHS